MKTQSKKRNVKIKTNPNMDLFYQSLEMADKQYKKRNFYEPTPEDHPFKELEDHPAVRTMNPETFNRYENNKEKLKLANKIYNKLVVQRDLSNLLKGVLEFK